MSVGQRAPESVAAAEPERASEVDVEPTEGVEALVRIKGVGPKTAKHLLDAGVRSLADVAAWDEAALARVAKVLGKKPAQLEKAGWVESARELLAERDA